MDQAIEWEAALFKISYPGVAYNVYDGIVEYRSFSEKKATMRTICIPRGRYIVLEEIIKIFNTKFDEVD